MHGHACTPCAHERHAAADALEPAGDGETERDRGREWQAGRQAGRQAQPDRETDTDRHRQTDRQRDSVCAPVPAVGDLIRIRGGVCQHTRAVPARARL